MTAIAEKNKQTSSEKFTFKGDLATMQKMYRGRNKPQYIQFNAHQNLLYKRALMGVKYYSKEEIRAMNDRKRSNINRICRKTQSVLNLWKQELCNDLTNKLFMSLFPNSQFVKDLVTKHGNLLEPSYINTLDFGILGIGNRQIAEKLILEGILPKNFFDLEDKGKKLGTFN